jgi:hypothetical protein
MRFDVLMALSMKMTLLLDVPSFSLVEIYRCFRRACCPHHRPDGGSERL